MDLVCDQNTSKFFTNQQLKHNEEVVLRSYVASDCRTKVVERSDDLLTKDDYQRYPREVAAATLEELETWIHHKCFTRKPRKGARNVLDVRWVARWKYRKDPKDSSKQIRTIRMRLTLRGFKDTEAEDLVTFAGTSSRLSQRIVVSEAVMRGWPLATVDVKQAFLKGITYDELARTTQEPAREVNFELPRDAVAVLRQCRGYENFDPTTEVLHMTRPGTGCKDAPRCFAIKLSQATNSKFGAKPTTHDPQLIVRHDSRGQLDFIATKHVDDIKVGPMRKFFPK